MAARSNVDPIENIPDPDTLRVMIAEAVRQRELLRSLLRVSLRKSKYPPPTRRARNVSDDCSKELAHAAG